LGDADHAIRVLSFAGGDFDTVMQLGAAHALLVIQGRAPDAVVGISAGAIQAAAVAEILQADESVEPDGQSIPLDAASRNDGDAAAHRVRSYRQRQEARVEKLRNFINAAQTAPEALLDASLPDAYQIESHNPLQPLRTARFAKAERDGRERMLQVRSGLVHLYNDLLRIHLPVGILARIVRRWLGLQAAAECSSWIARLAVQAMELYRIWLLIGSQLHRLVSVVPVLVRPLFMPRTRSRVATAGSLIFQFRALRVIGSAVGYFAMLFILTTAWVTLSVSPALLLYFFNWIDASTGWQWMALIVLLPALIPLAMTLLQVISRHDALTQCDALRDGLKGLFLFLVLLVVWGGVALVLWAIIAPHILGQVAAIVAGSPWDVNPFASVNVASMLKLSTGPFLVGTGIFLIVCFAAVLLFWRERAPISGTQPRMSFVRWYGKRFLQSYNLSRSLLHHYALEKFLVDYFDPGYYGPRDTGKMLERALRPLILKPADGVDLAGCCSKTRKVVSHYYAPERRRPIVVGLGVANVGTGDVDVMDANAPLICGLRAAAARAPFLPPVNYRETLYTDCSNVTPVPMPVLLKLLQRHDVHDAAKIIHVYRASPVPFSQPRLPRRNASQPFVNLVDIALRAFKLRQFRDADLERRLTHHYTHVIPPAATRGAAPQCRHQVEFDTDKGKKKQSFYRIWIAPIELEMPLGLNQRIIFSNRVERRAEILHTLAQGCRAALQVMIPDALSQCAREANLQYVPCGRAVRVHLKQRSVTPSITEVAGEPLPGSKPVSSNSNAKEAPPGLAEICDHCYLDSEDDALPESRHTQVLVAHKWRDTAPSWPHEFEAREKGITDAGFADKHFDPLATDAQTPDLQTLNALGRYWPQPRPNDNVSGDAATAESSAPMDRPTVSLLFSGGVFRGVFQIGVVNALHILGVKPDIVAGASVGSITAAIAAQILGVSKHKQAQMQTTASRESPERAQQIARQAQMARSLQIARLACTYLAIDRIILTDRFADFVREFTIRSADTHFSLRQADQLFRKYDQPRTLRFNHGARRVIAGIERLFYVNVYQLNQLTALLRGRNGHEALSFAKQLAQQWLDRMRVGEEIMGAEALEQLIRYFIIDHDACDDLKQPPTDIERLQGGTAHFIAHGVIFLATTTDLNEGVLVNLGDPLRSNGASSPLDLTKGLLASSAFPGVFRPLWSTELFPFSHRDHQYIDGGVMDNLPIDAVAHFLGDTSAVTNHGGLIKRRPTSGVPHLVFAASLEPHVALLDGAALYALQDDWPALVRRVKQLSYNRKLNTYHQAAYEIGRLHDHYYDGQQAPDSTADKSVNLEITALKPNWLCGTFAFHPMLGYRRHRQAQSIAHGCAMTLLKFREYDEKRLTVWGIDDNQLPSTADLSEAQKDWNQRRKSANPGECWLRQGAPCPFSKAYLDALNQKIKQETQQCDKCLDSTTIAQIARIHTCCSHPGTHKVH
jgi:predicted acylesterase/phospholipase RssA